MDVEGFRDNMPEFGDSTMFSDSRINRWLTLAYQQLRPEAWSATLDRGVELFVAHHLTVQQRAITAASQGLSFGENAGPTSSKSVGPASISRDIGSVTFDGAGSYNTTSYGVEFFRLLLVAGMGGVQVSGDVQ